MQILQMYRAIGPNNLLVYSHSQQDADTYWTIHGDNQLTFSQVTDWPIC